jgi:hypothetical protein
LVRTAYETLDRKIEPGATRTGLAAADDLSEHEVLYFGVLSDSTISVEVLF